MPNEVNIEITSSDLSGPGFASAVANMAKLKAAAKALSSEMSGITLGNVDPGKMNMALQMLKSRLQSLGIADIADVNIPVGKLTTQLMVLKRLINQTGISDMLDVNISNASLAAQLAKLQSLAGNIPLSVDINDASIAKAAAELAALNLPSLGETVSVGGLGGINNAIAAFRALDAVAAKLGPDLLRLPPTIDEMTMSLEHGQNIAWTPFVPVLEEVNKQVAAGIPLVTGFGWGWGILTGHVQLFGGALSQIGIPSIIATASGLHIVADAIVEISATLIPAAVAFGAFGVGAVDTVMEIYSHIQDLDKANDELGGTIYPLTGGFTKLAAAVQPAVYTAFGEGLVIVSHNAGAFTQIAKAAGTVVDQLGARMTYAIDSGNGFGAVFRNGAADLAGWGDLIGNLAGILGNLFKAMPGYAQILLGLADNISHIAEVATGAATPVLKLGLALHGAILYIGLAATAGTWLITSGLGLLASGSVAAAGALDGLGVAGGVAADGLLAVGAAAETAATLPWGWILAAVAGIALLAIEFSKVKDAAQQFNATVEQTIQNAPLLSLNATIMSAIAQTASKLAMSEVNLAATEQRTGDKADYMTGRVSASNQELYNATRNVSDYQAGLQAIEQQQTLVATRVNQLAGRYGGATAALSLLNAAGITSAQITDTNNQHWAQALIEVQAQHDALVALTGDTGRYEAALNVLSGPEQYLGDMLKSIQAITQGQDNLIANLVQGQGALDTFEEGIYTLAQNLNSATGSTASVTDTLGKLSSKASLAGAALSGTSQASYNLNQSFYTEVQNSQKVIDALEQQEATTGQLTTATATISQQMIGFAGNNTAARATIVAMINDALGPGTVSLKTLNSWVNTNSTSLGGLNSIINAVTINAGQLSNVLQQQLTAQFRTDLLASSGATEQMKLFTDAIVNGGTQTDNYRSARARLIQDLENTGLTAQQAKNYVNNLQNQIDAMHGKSVGVGVAGVGEYSATQVSKASLADVEAHIERGFAGGTSGAPAGWAWVGEKGPELVNLPGGTQVVPNFAAGTPGAIPSLVQSMTSNDTTSAMAAGLASLMAKSINALGTADMKKAAAALGGYGGGGPTGGAAYALEKYAASLFPRYGWAGDQILPLGALWNKESGWNRFADNPSSGAYGIAQALPPTKYPFAGQAAGGSSAAAQISWGEQYIAGRYGSPAGAWAHEMAYNWYDNGGWAPPGASILLNGTGAPEHLSRDGSGPVQIIVSYHPSATRGLGAGLLSDIKYTVRTQGGGDVQSALGVSQ